MIEYSQFTDEEFFNLGHDPNDMIPFCSFRGKACNYNDFGVFRDSRYGTCVTYNSGRTKDDYYMEKNINITLKNSTNTGPQYGKCYNQ